MTVAIFITFEHKEAKWKAHGLKRSDICKLSGIMSPLEKIVACQVYLYFSKHQEKAHL